MWWKESNHKVFPLHDKDRFCWRKAFMWLFGMNSDGKESACSSGDLGSIPGLGRPLQEGMATHSSILAWRILWMEESGGLQSIRSQESDMTEWLSLSLNFLAWAVLGTFSMKHCCYLKEWLIVKLWLFISGDLTDIFPKMN